MSLLEAVVLVAVHLERGDINERPLRVHHDLEAVSAERLGHRLLAEHVLQHLDEALFEVDLVHLGGRGDVLGRVDRVRLQHGRQHRVRVPGDDSELISGNGIIPYVVQEMSVYQISLRYLPNSI